jgi:hypothetical protein
MTAAPPSEEAGLGPIQRAAAQVYDEGGWPVSAMEDGTGFTVDIEGSDGTWSGLAITDDDADRFVFYSLAPVDTPPRRIGQMAELLHRINHGLVAGTFELDHDSGEVRLRTGIELITMPPVLREDAEVLRGIVLDVSAANVELMDRYLSGIVAAAVSDIDPAAVVAEIERDPYDDE